MGTDAAYPTEEELRETRPPVLIVDHAYAPPTDPSWPGRGCVHVFGFGTDSRFCGREPEAHRRVPSSATQDWATDAGVTDLRDEPPWDELDSGIRDVVRALWEAGLAPIASCQGHGRDDAFVALEVAPSVGSTPGVIKDLLRERGWSAHSIVSTNVDDSGYVWFEVRWWGRVPYR